MIDIVTCNVSFQDVRRKTVVPPCRVEDGGGRDAVLSVHCPRQMAGYGHQQVSMATLCIHKSNSPQPLTPADMGNVRISAHRKKFR